MMEQPRRFTSSGERVRAAAAAAAVENGKWLGEVCEKLNKIF